MKRSMLFLFAPIFSLAADTQEYPSYSNKSIQAELDYRATQITLPTGPLKGHSYDVVLDAEFLYLKASTSEMSYATKYQTVSAGNTLDASQVYVIPKESFEFDWKWDPGARVALGLVTDYDGWDLFLSWTYYYNSAKNSQTVPTLTLATFEDGPVGNEALASRFSLFGNNAAYTDLSGHWSFLLNDFDLKLGRDFWISKTLSLHPFVGLRGLWSHMNLTLSSSFQAHLAGGSATELERYGTEIDKLRQKFWGVGLLAGINTSWFFARDWAVFGDFGFSLPYGEFSYKRRSDNFGVNFNDAVIVDVDSTFVHNGLFALQPIVDLAIGFRYQTTVANNSCIIRADAGWESHVFFDHNQLEQVLSNNTSTEKTPITPLSGNVNLTGLVVRLAFEF